MSTTNNQVSGIMDDFNKNLSEAPTINVTPNPTTPVPTQAETPQPADSLDFNNLNDNDKKVVQDIVSKIDLSTSDGVISYGSSTQQKIADFCEKILSTIKTKELDSSVATNLVDLASEISNFEVEDEHKKGILSSIFSGLGKGTKKIGDGLDNAGKEIKHQISISKKEAEKMMMKYENVEKVVDSIVVKLEQSKQQLIRNVTIMNSMYDTNIEYYKELTYILIAAKEKLKSFSNEVEVQKEKAAKLNDQMEIQKFNEMNDIKNKFEKKIDDLLRTRLISIQNAPQIRLIQQGSEQLVYQIQNSIFTAIPVWKSQIVICLGIENNKTALGLEKQINETTNNLLRKNSELLKQGTLEIAEEGEKGIVSLETLQITNTNLIDTINGVMDIQKRGKEERAVAEVEIKKLEEQIKQTLLSN